MSRWDGILCSAKGKVFNRSLFVGGACHLCPHHLRSLFVVDLCHWQRLLRVCWLLCLGQLNSVQMYRRYDIVGSRFYHFFLDVCGLEGENNSLRSCKKPINSKLHSTIDFIKHTSTSSRKGILLLPGRW